MSFIKKKKTIFKHTREQKRIYANTTKPKEYVRVDNPKTDQEKRQVMFNNWCKAHNVYCGSYLPVQHKDLLKCGWKLTGSFIYKRNSNSKHLKQRPIYHYKRKSTGQEVHFHKEVSPTQIEHYHNVFDKKKDLFID